MLETAINGTEQGANQAGIYLLNRLMGLPSQAIGGSEELGPVKHVVTWEDGT